MPPGEPGRGPSSLSSLFDRLNEAAQQGAQARSGVGRRYQPEEARTVTFAAEDIPDLTPVAKVVLVVVSVLIALTIAGTVAAAWETVLLWQNRVPFSPDTATAVVDPIFNRDIGFFLFELPFLRFVQALFNGVVVATLIVVGARYLVGAMRGGLVFITPVRVHLARPGWPVPAVGRVRLPARQVRALVQRPGHRDGRRPTRTRTPSSSPTTCSRSCPAWPPPSSSGPRSPG